MLFDASVQNLHGPILAPHAINDTTNVHRIAGNTDRTKVCHFVRARLLSTFHFLSIRTNQDDACILLNRCFERMALLTIQQQAAQSWIKPVYTTINDEATAEAEFQEKVFYHTYQKLNEYKAYVNHLNLQSQIQSNLQAFITGMPILVQYLHFRTEFNNPIHAALPLKVLRYVLDSTEFLAITKSIHDLSQFYLLLHQTYTLLIERDEFLTITLDELHKRSEERGNGSTYAPGRNQQRSHAIIIDNGIKAVNDYHQFADGLIRPGPCDATQRFMKISRETPVHYIVTTENPDEGDIIMRILR